VERIAEKRHVAGLPRGHRDRRLDGKRLDRRRICLFDEASQRRPISARLPCAMAVLSRGAAFPHGSKTPTSHRLRGRRKPNDVRRSAICRLRTRADRQIGPGSQTGKHSSASRTESGAMSSPYPDDI
jgi:hypothetical protein